MRADPSERGREPNGATWLVYRGATAWCGARRPSVDGVYADPVRGVLELLPAISAETPLHPRELILPDGTRYRCRDTTVERAAGAGTDAPQFRPLPGFGGRGWVSGRVRRPLGLAVDACGLLYVADSGNHRVQVVRPADGAVVTLIGRHNDDGRPLPGDEDGAMREPVDVVVDSRRQRTYVADRAGGRVHVFGSRLQWLRSFVPAPAAGRAPDVAARLIAIDVRADGTLLVADARWPRLLHLSDRGQVLGELSSWSDIPRFAGLRLPQRFRAEGEAIIGPLDSGQADTAWHEVAVTVSAPAGTSLELATYASDEPTAPPAALWAPERPVPVPAPGEPDDDGEYRRLVLATSQSGSSAGSDRGRYLFVRARLVASGGPDDPAFSTATPSLSGLRLLYDRSSPLALLPATFAAAEDADSPPGAPFLERFLTLFDGQLNRIERHYEAFSRCLSPDVAPPEWLAWLGGWLHLAFAPALPEPRRRQLVREAVWLYRQRGTVAGLARWLELYTGQRPAIVEGFTLRPLRSAPLGGDARLGCLPLAGHTHHRGDGDDTTDDAHRFSVYVFLEHPCDEEAMLPLVRHIVELHKPAHTACAIHLVRPHARIGLQSTVGIDLVLGERSSPAAVLGESRRLFLT